MAALPALVGRETEQAAVARVLTTVREGLSAVLVVRGEAGIGKTALLDTAIEAAGDFSVTRLVGIESEMHLGYAALHQLLTPFLSEIDSLPPPQAHALRAAFGFVDGDASGEFFVGLAALTLLANAATYQPQLVVVDDAQWLDHESATVLGLVARRLFADRVALLIGVRGRTDQVRLDGLPTLTLGPLSERMAVELLEAAATRSVGSLVRDRILADARGNPLALVELTRELSVDQLAGVAMLPDVLPIGGGLDAQFLRQVRQLPAEAQQFLLVAAAEPTGEPGLVWRAGRLLGFDESSVLPAEEADLLSLGPPIRFRHPLIRSTVYQHATDEERRQAHAALAAATDSEHEPDRHAWHLAAATLVPDEDVAIKLEQAAHRARNRGGFTAAVAMLERAARLTPDAKRRAFRYFLAASAGLPAGGTVAAYTHLQLALPDLDDPTLAAQARRLEAAIIFTDSRSGSLGSAALGRYREIVSIMVNAALTLGPLDIRMARDTLLDAMRMANYFGEASWTTVREVALAAEHLQLPADSLSTSSDPLLDALARLYAVGLESAAPLLRTALARVRTDPAAPQSPRLLAVACWAASALGDDEAFGALANECAAICRDRGTYQVLFEALATCGFHQLRVGTPSAADRYFVEERDLEVLLGRTGPAEALCMVPAAWFGREADVRTAVSRLMAEAREAGIGLTLRVLTYAVVVLELGLGNYRAAAAASPQSFDVHFSLAALSAADAVEAHVRTGDHAAAAGALGSLSIRASASQSPLDLGLAARGRALLSEPSEAEQHFQQSIAHLEGAGAQLHVARTQLLYGEWLRRQTHRSQAREQLGAALATFDSMGVNAFADRARIELRATGMTVRKRIDSTRHLTAQEEQVARLAAVGATNSEIASRLYISANTVDYHLRKVFRKLGITSRRELVRTDLGSR